MTLKREHVFKLEHKACHEVLEPLAHELNELHEEVELWRCTLEIDVDEHILKEWAR